jgi:hypothetical protein
MFYLATIPLVSAAMFIPYVLMSGRTLTSEKVFTVVSIVSAINVVASVFVPRCITALKESGVSLDRIGVGVQLAVRFAEIMYFIPLLLISNFLSTRLNFVSLIIFKICTCSSIFVSYH